MKLELAFNLTDATRNSNIFEWDAKLKRMPVCKLNNFVSPHEIFNTIKKEGIYKGMKAGLYSLPISATFKMAIQIEPLGDGSYVLCTYEPKLSGNGGIDFTHKYTFMYFGSSEVFESRITCCERPLTTIFDNLTERSLFECGISLDYLLEQATQAKCSSTVIKYLKELVQTTTVTSNKSIEGQNMKPQLKLVPHVTFIESDKPNAVIFDYPGVRYFPLREAARRVMYDGIVKGEFDTEHTGLVKVMEEDKNVRVSEFLKGVDVRVERAYLHFTFKFAEGIGVNQSGVVIRDALTHFMNKLKADLRIHPTSLEQTITFALLDPLGEPIPSIASLVRMYHWFKENVSVEVVLDTVVTSINDEDLDVKSQDIQPEITVDKFLDELGLDHNKINESEPQSLVPSLSAVLAARKASQESESITPKQVVKIDPAGYAQFLENVGDRFLEQQARGFEHHPIPEKKSRQERIPEYKVKEERHDIDEEESEGVSLYESMIEAILKFDEAFDMAPSCYTLAEIIARDYDVDALKELDDLTSRQVYVLADSLGLTNEKASVFNEYIMQFMVFVEQQQG